MKPTRTYTSPETVKQALDQRLKTSSKSGADFARTTAHAFSLRIEFDVLVHGPLSIGYGSRFGR
ncbi:MAG: hypothetical protein FWD73_04415 [Polyangiaceae bacterium]|nr:hypothetical protein [Polyangiaceae bacterium]